MTVKKPRQEEFTSKAGNNYIFQSVANSTYLEVMDNAVKADGNPSLSRLYPSVLEHVVVQPSALSVDDFDSFEELQEVCESALRFQQS